MRRDTASRGSRSVAAVCDAAAAAVQIDYKHKQHRIIFLIYRAKHKKKNTGMAMDGMTTHRIHIEDG